MTTAFENTDWNLKAKDTAKQMSLMVTTIQKEAEEAILELNDGLAKMNQRPLSTEEASQALVTTLKLIEHLSLRAGELVSLLQQMSEILPSLATVLEELSDFSSEDLSYISRIEVSHRSKR